MLARALGTRTMGSGRVVRPARGRVSLVLLAIAALLWANMATLLHEVLVRHERCVEHGELVHVDRVAAPTRTVDDPGSGSDEPLARIARTGQGSDAHEHCLLCLGTRDRAVLGRASAIVLEPPPSGVDTPRAMDEWRAPSARLYRVAPKTSPPA